MAAAAQGKFWEFHDLLYEHEGPRDRAVLEELAKRVGLAMEPFLTALDERRYLDSVRTDAALAYALGIGATPTFVINGRVVQGAVPYAELAAQVAERLAEARALVKNGVPRTEVYEAVVRNASIVEVGAE